MPPTNVTGLSVRARIEMFAEKTRPRRQAPVEPSTKPSQRKPLAPSYSTGTLDGIRKKNERQAQLELLHSGHVQAMPTQSNQVVPPTETCDGVRQNTECIATLRVTVEETLDMVKIQLLNIIDQREGALLDKINRLQSKQADLVIENESWRKLFMATTPATIPHDATEGILFECIAHAKKLSLNPNPQNNIAQNIEPLADDCCSLQLQHTESTPELESQGSFYTSPSFFGEFSKKGLWENQFEESNTSRSSEDDGFRTIPKTTLVQHQFNNEVQNLHPSQPQFNNQNPSDACTSSEGWLGPRRTNIRKDLANGTVFV